MSGRPRPGRGDAAEQLRELTREAHAAAKDLRLAIRETREEAARLQASHQAAAAAAAAAAVADASDQLRRAAGHLQQQSNLVTDHIARLLGTASAEEITDEIISRSSADLARMLSAELLLPPGAALQLRSRGRTGAAGELYITTDPALAPPGSVIIDGR